ncbi:uncharacterized protein BDV14DRAFT_199883 [Aspergillus stella-maris]|uniref:uncharacterized protein n=1 Tax=Aspergillus stella-maris TaxID=1810926 RepID=UPI003CCD1EB6
MASPLSSLSSQDSSPELSKSWIRQSTAPMSHGNNNNDGVVVSPSDIAITQLAIMGLWMGRNCREITNNTDAVFQLDSKADTGGVLGQGYSASITSVNDTLMVNGSRSNSLHVVRKHVRLWGSEGRQTALDTVREIRVLTHQPIRRHSNIISLVAFEWVFWPGENPGVSPVLCLERSELGDLATFQREHKLQYETKKRIFLDVANGLLGLHETGVVHGDIKSENILIFESDEGYTAKLCDFGFAVFLADISKEKARLLGGTHPWTAPEWKKELPFPRYFLKLTDVYSLGLLLWRLLLDGDNPFKHLLLKDKNIDQAKVEDPPLLYYAQASILPLPDYAFHLLEIFALLACTIQRNPSKRNLRAAIRIASDEEQLVSRKILPQLTNNPLFFAEGSQIKNICVPVRLRVLGHLRRSAIQMPSDPAWRSDFPGENPVVMSLIEHALGDGGLALDDDPAEIMRWITHLANHNFVPMQGIIVRMYDYFGQPMPLEVQQKANEYLANGVVNGSVTAASDYERYWPTLQYQTWDSPDDFFFTSRTFHGNGVGFRLDHKAAELQDTASVYENLRAFGGKQEILCQLYGLDKGNTLLHGCAMLGLAETAQMLISAGADTNARNDNGDTPLLLACRNGKFPMMLKLVTKGARADIPNKYGEMPLHWVLNIPNDTIVHAGIPGNMLTLAIDMCLHAGGRLDAKAEMWCSAGDYYDRLRWAAGTPLHRAVSRRNIPAARVLLLRGSDATCLDGREEQLTPLDIAMHHHNEPMLHLLLDNCKSKVNTHYASGHTLYSRAVASVKILEMIIIHGKEYPKAVNDTLNLLIFAGFDISRAQTDYIGGHKYELDALFVAVRYEKLAWVQFFLSSRLCMEILDINRPNGEFGMTPLHQSIHDHTKSIFMALLEAGADPSRTCSIMSLHHATSEINMRITSLHLVAQQGDPDLFFTNRLLHHGLEIDVPDPYGITPFATAVIEGNLHIANSFLEHGADINRHMGTAKSNPEDRRSILANILSRDCTLIVNRLKYLLCDPEDVDPALQRHGSPAAFEVGESISAFHVFLNAQKGRQDGPFRACLAILLRAFSAPWQLDYRDKKGRTPLHIAAMHGNTVAVSALKATGARSDVMDNEEKIPGGFERGQLQ